MSRNQSTSIELFGGGPPCSCQSDTGLAEIAIALAYLKPNTDELRKTIAVSLGFDYQPKESEYGSRSPDSPKPGHPEHTLPAVDMGAFERSKFVGQSEQTDVENVSNEEGSNWPSGDVASGDDGELTLVRVAEILTTCHDKTALDAAPLEITEITKHLQALMHVPLLHDQWFAGIMSALLATTEESGEIDVRLLEKQITSGRPFVRLPFRRRPVLRRGVQIILDHSDSMQPFWRDQQLLLERLENWLGYNRVRDWAFEFDACRPPEFRFNWFSPNPDALCPETPLLFVSDFGMGKDDWSETLMECGEFLNLLVSAKALGCRLLALVPLPASLWPSRLTLLMDHVIEWDRSTSPQTVRRSRNRAFG